MCAAYCLLHLTISFASPFPVIQLGLQTYVAIHRKVYVTLLVLGHALGCFCAQSPLAHNIRNCPRFCSSSPTAFLSAAWSLHHEVYSISVCSVLLCMCCPQVAVLVAVCLSRSLIFWCLFRKKGGSVLESDAHRAVFQYKLQSAIIICLRNF